MDKKAIQELLDKLCERAKKREPYYFQLKGEYELLKEISSLLNGECFASEREIYDYLYENFLEETSCKTRKAIAKALTNIPRQMATREEIDKILEEVDKNSYCSKLGMPARRKHYVDALLGHIPKIEGEQKTLDCGEI